MTDSVQTQDWLVGYFSSRHSSLPENVREVNFLEAGLIDSFDIILLIEELEAEFDVKFSERDFQDRRFVTISGLAEIVAEQKNG